MTERAVAVCIARLQPVQQRQADALRELCARHAQVLLVVGGVTQAASVINPWTLAERRRMLDLVLGEECAKLSLLPTADCWYDDRRWAAVVRAAVATEVARAAQPAQGVVLYGLEREGARYYAPLFPDWQMGEVDAPAFVPTLHERLLGAQPRLAFEAVPAPLHDWLIASLDEPLRRELREEFRFVQRYRDDWAAAPYTPVFVTVDALVTHGEQVLVIARGRRPGVGLLALPGGFIDVHEFIRDSALRELREETGLVLGDEDCSAVRVYDHPLRSLRGRIVTHLHRYELPADRPAPAVQGGDDAAQARWLPFDAARADLFFEDHYAMLQVELGLP